MSVYNPTLYSAAELKTSAGATTIDNQTQGSLDCCVALPYQFSYNGESAPTFTENWKCPTSKVIKFTNGVYKIYNVEVKEGQPRPDFESNSNFIARFSPPDLPASYNYWVIKSISFRELDAGDHCLMTINHEGSWWTTEVSAGTNLELEDTWNLEWQAQNISPLAYCKNEGKAPLYVKNVPGAEAIYHEQEDSSIYAEAQYIKECANKNSLTLQYGALKPDEWVRGMGIYELNTKEEAIFKYYQNGIGALKHVPVLTHTWVTSIAKELSTYREIDGTIKHVPYSPNDKCGAMIDEVVPLSGLDSNGMPKGCPYAIVGPLSANSTYDEKNYTWKSDPIQLSAWEWLVTGDKTEEFSQTGKTLYKRQKQYTGAMRWCGNFYQHGSWFMTPSVSNYWVVGGE